MFYFTAGEYIAANCSVNNAVNISIVGQGSVSSFSESATSNLIVPITSSLSTVFTAAENTMVTHIILTNTTNSDITSVNLYLNGAATANKFLSNVRIKANTTVTLHSGGFSQYPQEVPTGGGSVAWGGITGTITAQTDLTDNFQLKLFNGTSGEAISSGMAVVIWTDAKIYKYNIANDNHAGLTCGIAKTSTSAVDEAITVTLPGNSHVEVGSGWAEGINYYVSATSTLTATPPATGIIKHIGTGFGVDTVLITNYNEFITI